MAPNRSKHGTVPAERRKRTSGRHNKAVAAPGKSSVEPITLDNFPLLPHELKARIFDLACSPSPSSPSKAAASRATLLPPPRPPRRDLETTLDLMFASRSFYAFVAPSLYGRVWISRPSTLACFHRALISHPALGSPVKSIHIGADEVVPENEFPLLDEGRQSYGRGAVPTDAAYIRCSLRSVEESDLLPRWCSEFVQWPLASPYQSPSSKAIFTALHSIQQTIDIDLRSHKRSHRGDSISHAEYTIRLWEGQAALDCYLLAMGRYDNDHTGSPSLGQCGLPAYPPLVLTGYPGSPRTSTEGESDETCWTFSRTQLIQHLCRRQSCTDRFNHPVLFARSGIDIPNDHDLEYDPELPHDANGFGGRGWPNLFSLTGPEASAGLLLPNTATLGSLINLCRSTLLLLVNLETLSLTGSLELALSGCNLDTVRNLAIGPGGSRVKTPLQYQVLAGVEELRLCGTSLNEADLEEMFAKMPSLRWLEVSNGQCRYYEYLRALAGYKPPTAVSEAMLGAQVASSDSGMASTIPTSERPVDDSNTITSSDNDSSLPLIEAFIYPDDMRSLQEQPEFAAVREAWTSGRALPGQRRRLLLTGSWRGADLSMKTYSLKDLYAEGRDWWERHVKGRVGCGGL